MARKDLLHHRQAYLWCSRSPQAVSDFRHQRRSPNCFQRHDLITKLGKRHSKHRVGAPRLKAHANKMSVPRPLDHMMPTPNSYTPAAFITCPFRRAVKSTDRTTKVDLKVECWRWKNLLAAIRHRPLHV